MTKNWKKYSWIFYQKLQFSYPLGLGLHKGRQATCEAFSPSRENIQHFNSWNLLTVFYLFEPFFPYWIRIRIQGPHWIRIRIRIHSTGLSITFNCFFCIYVLFVDVLGAGTRPESAPPTDSMSSTARLILDTLDKMSTPLMVNCCLIIDIEFRKGWSSPVLRFCHNPLRCVDGVHH
jgi:hypothetical protein